MKKIWISAVMVIGMLGVAGVMYFSSGAKASAMPVVVEDIQYPFEKGGGLVNIRVGEDVFLGVSMITGKMMPDGFSKDGFTGSVNFEMPNPKPGFRVQVDGIRLIERTPKGDGRVFEPFHVYDEAMMKNNPPRVQFLTGPRQFPVAWEGKEKHDLLYFVFPDLPRDLTKADLVLTYNGKFPGKKHIAYYEDRFSVTRKAYLRN